MCAPWGAGGSRGGTPLTIALLLPWVALLVGVLLLGVGLRLGGALLVPGLLLAVLGVPCREKGTRSPPGGQQQAQAGRSSCCFTTFRRYISSSRENKQKRESGMVNTAPETEADTTRPGLSSAPQDMPKSREEPSSSYSQAWCPVRETWTQPCR